MSENINNSQHNFNKEEYPDSLPLITTDVETRTSDIKHVNDDNEPRNKFNCYLTTAGGLMGKPVSELNTEISDLIWDRACGAEIERIDQIYSRLGFKDHEKLDDVRDFKTSIKTNIKKGERKKYAFGCLYERKGDDGNIERWGHIIGLKVQVKENNHYSYRFIDYQLEPDDKNRPNRYFKNKLPPCAVTPFYLWEKIYYNDQTDMDYE